MILTDAVIHVEENDSTLSLEATFHLRVHCIM